MRFLVGTFIASMAVSSCLLNAAAPVVDSVLSSKVESLMVTKDSFSRVDLKGANLFFGTGLCTKDALNAGLPFDFLLYPYRS